MLQIIHNRFFLLVFLRDNKIVSFKQVEQSTGLKKGSVTNAMRALNKEGFVKIEKTSKNRKPITYYSLTNEGLIELEFHIELLKKIVCD